MSWLSERVPLRVRSWGVALVLLAGAILFAAVMSSHYAIERWLFWRYVGYWFGAVAWAGCCSAFGCFLLSKSGIRLARLDFLTLGIALGVFCFGLAIFGLGLLHLLNVVTFFALPLSLLAASFGYLRHNWRRHGEAALSSLRELRFSPTSLALTCLGLVGIAALYVQVLTPDAFSFDTRWYHLPIAQRYALSQAVSRFPEGFWMAAYPQLASYLYTWAFLAPLPLLFDRLQLCSHLEFTVFLLTLAQIPVLVRTLVPRSRPWLAWVALFAFPAIYLYDSNLHAGADHIAALFAVPIALSFWRAWRHFEPRTVLLFSVFVSAAALSKYTGVLMVASPGLALLARALWLSFKRHDRRTLLALALLIIAPLLLTTPHWLKNWVWYGDPIYPILHARWPGRPWHPDATIQLAILEGVARPGQLNLPGLLAALRATVTFSFEANDWFDLRRNYPEFGSLFTLTLPALLFVRQPRRILWLGLLSMSAVFFWYLLSHYERFLQVVLPWMVAATVATLVRIWQLGFWPRLALAPLLILQFVWGSDVPFVRTHNLIGDSPVRRALLLPSSGFERVPNRLKVFEPFGTLGAATPKDAVLLAHDIAMILGFDRNWVTDIHQSLISYGRLREPKAIHDTLRGLGVTHLLWPEWTFERESLAADLAFMNYALNYTKPITKTGGYHVAALPDKPPLKRGGDSVALFSCGGVYSKGWYQLSDLTRPRIMASGPVPRPRGKLSNVSTAAETADYIVWNPSCNHGTVPGSFTYAAARAGEQLWVRNQHQNPAKTP
jgi:hypothetical protein